MGLSENNQYRLIYEYWLAISITPRSPSEIESDKLSLPFRVYAKWIISIDQSISLDNTQQISIDFIKVKGLNNNRQNRLSLILSRINHYRWNQANIMTGEPMKSIRPPNIAGSIWLDINDFWRINHKWYRLANEYCPTLSIFINIWHCLGSDRFNRFRMSKCLETV